ncbi:MAG: hypothetical protein ACKVQB_04860 [Bacteroidia bacterium]
MNSYDKKLQQIRLQHQIGEILENDNGVSCHFDYHINMMSDDETIKLNLLTYNPAHENYMLLHSTSGKSSIDCLEKMKIYLNEFYNPQFLYSFTIEWKKKDEPLKHISYFRAADEAAAKAKFLHEKEEAEYDYTILRNPIS